MNLRAPDEPMAITEARRQVVAFAADVGANDSVREAVQLAVSEALTNIVVHAYVRDDPGDLIVEAWRDEDGYLTVLISDEGSDSSPVRIAPVSGWGWC